MRRLGRDCPDVAQSMHSLDVDVDIRHEIPIGTDEWRHVAGRKRCRMPVIDVYPVRRRGKGLATIERGGGRRDGRPRICVLGRFACEVAGFEFREGGVDVVEVEGDRRRDPLVAIYLNDMKGLGVERLNSLATSRVARMCEGHTLAPDRNHVRRRIREPDIGGRSPLFDFGIPTVRDPAVHGSPAVVDGRVMGE
jgi:hypothetical protein